MDTKINIYILSIFLKQHNFLIILIVISPTSITKKHLKSTIYKKSVENEPPFDRLMTSLVEHVVNIKYA